MDTMLAQKELTFIYSLTYIYIYIYIFSPDGSGAFDAYCD